MLSTMNNAKAAEAMI